MDSEIIDRLLELFLTSLIELDMTNSKAKVFAKIKYLFEQVEAIWLRDKLKVRSTNLQQRLGKLKIFLIGYFYVVAAAGYNFNNPSQAFH